MRPPTIQALRAALWALRSVRSARRQLRRSRYEGISLPAVPQVSEAAGHGVNAVLRRLPATCLERAVVLQRWRATYGDLHDVVVGVSGTREDFKAHAWLDDESPAADAGSFRELVRLRP